MKKRNFTKLIVAVFIVFVGLIVFGLINNQKKASTPIGILVKEINTTPSNYLGEKKKADSVLFRAYHLKENEKWKTKYRFAFELPEGSGFDWKKYLDTHPEDAVDGGLGCHVIFSNQFLDLKYFRKQ